MASQHSIEDLCCSVERNGKAIGSLVSGVFHMIALFAIGLAVVWAAVLAFMKMIASGHVSVEDILLLFIYVELGAMVGIYFKTNHMPARFLVYIAITALTRMLVGIVGTHHNGPEVEADMGIVLITVAILILALSVLALRFASHRFPSPTGVSDPRIPGVPDIAPYGGGSVQHERD